MTISAYPSLIEKYKGDGLQEEWPVHFPFLMPSDLGVILTAPDKSQRKLRLDFDYVVVLSNEIVGGTVVTSVPEDYQITIYLEQPFTQEMDLRNNGVLDAEMLERSLDKLTLLTGQLKNQFERCVQADVTENISPKELYDNFQATAVKVIATGEKVQTDAEKTARNVDKISLALETLVSIDNISNEMLEQLGANYSAARQGLEDTVDTLLARLQAEFSVMRPSGEIGASLTEVRLQADESLAQITAKTQSVLADLSIQREVSETLKNLACECANRAVTTLENTQNLATSIAPLVQNGIANLEENKQRILEDFLSSTSNNFLNSFPRGFICLWNGQITTIPQGFGLCDGTNGTPDLRDRFVLGAGGTRSVGTTEGTQTHTHILTLGDTTLTTAQMPAHGHTLSNYTESAINSSNNNCMSPGVAGTAGVKTASCVKTMASFNIINPTGSGGSHTHTASSAYSDHMPPLYTLAYIMKL